MKNRIQISILFVGLSLLLGSCYEDKGNYDYHEINDIVIAQSEYTYTTPKEGQTYPVVIAPTITQTMTTGTENLAYEWKRQTGAIGWEVVGHDPTYTLIVTSSDTQPIVLRLAVTDLNQDIITYEEITVKPMFKFNQSWFLLQDIDGQAVLGCIDGEGATRDVTKDVYERENGASLSGKAVGLGMHNFLNTTPIKEGTRTYDVMLGVFTEGQPYMLKGATLENYKFSYSRLLYEKTVTGDATFDPQLMKSDRNNFVIVDNNKLWYAVPDELALMYPVELSAALGGGYNYEAQGVGFASGIQCIVYDGLGHRFLNYNNTGAYTLGYDTRQRIVEGAGSYNDLYMDESNVNRQAKLEEIPSSASNVFNPSTDVPGDYKLDYMGAGSVGTIETILAIGHSGQNFHIYEFYPEASSLVAGTAFCNGTWTVASQGTPSASADGKWQVATSSYFKRMFFYAAGNAVYRVDLTQSVPSVEVIYETDPEAGPIKLMKMKSDKEDIAYNVDQTGSNEEIPTKGIVHHLGVLQQDDAGNATLVELHLTAAGELELDANKEPVVYKFGGVFQNVVDMLFAFRDEI